MFGAGSLRSLQGRSLPTSSSSGPPGIPGLGAASLQPLPLWSPGLLSLCVLFFSYKAQSLDQDPPCFSAASSSLGLIRRDCLSKDRLHRAWGVGVDTPVEEPPSSLLHRDEVAAAGSDLKLAATPGEEAVKAGLWLTTWWEGVGMVLWGRGGDVTDTVTLSPQQSWVWGQGAALAHRRDH